MADRYLNIRINKSLTGKRYYKTTLYPDIEPKESDWYIEATVGDRLDNLAQEFYGDCTDYWIIQIANNMRKDTLYPTPGTQLRIPTDIDVIKQKFRELNNTR
jgi:hypothetical protein